jgi:hypothetical protein
MREEQKYPNPQSYGLKEVVKKKEVEAYSLLATDPMPSLDRTSVGRHSNGRGEKYDGVITLQGLTLINKTCKSDIEALMLLKWPC